MLDPFLGSGSTLIAAHRLKWQRFGIEVDPFDVGVTIRRFQAAQGHAVRLEAAGETFDEAAQRRIE